MDENVIVTTFGEGSGAYEALARLKELAAEDEIDLHDGAVVERAGDAMGLLAGAIGARVKARKELRHQRREATVEKVQAKLRERLGHLVHH